MMPITYDSAAAQIIVGYGDGAMAMIDAKSARVLDEIKLPAHPESFQLEISGSRAFINVPKAHEITVIDRTKKVILAHWSTGLAAANFPMSLDEPNHRLFIGCRIPARLLVFDTETGKEIEKLDLHGVCDDLFFDGARKQVYASCGEGYIDVFSQVDPDHYSLKDAIKTEGKARTCFFDGSRIYLVVPVKGKQTAKLLIYNITP